MTNSQLQADLSSAVTSAETLTRHQLLNITLYLKQALSYSDLELKTLFAGILQEVSLVEVPRVPAKVLNITSSSRWMPHTASVAR